MDATALITIVFNAIMPAIAKRIIATIILLSLMEKL